MEASGSGTARVLVVAHKTAATPALIDAVRRRAERGSQEFHLLVPAPHPTRRRRRDHLSTLPRAVSRWLHIDLPSRVAHLGLPVTTVVAHESVDAARA